MNRSIKSGPSLVKCCNYLLDLIRDFILSLCLPSPQVLLDLTSILFKLLKLSSILSSTYNLDYCPFNSQPNKTIPKLQYISLSILHWLTSQWVSQMDDFGSSDTKTLNIAATAPSIWNAIPNQIRQLTFVPSFRRALKTHLEKIALSI